MKMPSAAETMRIFEALGLKNEEDRIKILLLNRNYWAITPKLPNKDYYSIRLSTNSKVESAEDNCNAELEECSR